MPGPSVPDPDIIRFAKLAKLMRDGQKKFFAGTKTAAHIAYCKDLETRLDRAIAWVLKHDPAAPSQPELFPPAEETERVIGAYPRRRK